MALSHMSQMEDHFGIQNRWEPEDHFGMEGLRRILGKLFHQSKEKLYKENLDFERIFLI